MASSRQLPTNPTTHSYGVAGHGYTYTSLATWEADTDVNLVGTTTSYILECYDDGTAHNDRAYLDGATTSSTYYRLIKAAAAAENKGKQQGVVFNYTTAAANIVFQSGESFSSFHDLRVTGGFSFAGIIVGFHALNYNRIVGCYVHDFANAHASYGADGFAIYSATASAKYYFINCIAENCESAGFDVILGTSGTAYIFNCVAYGNGTYGFYRQDDTVKCTNCIGMANGTANFQGTITALTNATAGISFVDQPNGDYHINSVGGVGVGTDMSANADYAFDDDIDGTTITSHWSIGVDWFAPTAASNGSKSRKLPAYYYTNTHGGSTRGYTTVATWEADTDIDLVTLGAGHVLECHTDGGTYSASFSLAGATTNSSYYRVVKPGAGQKHDGTPNNGFKFTLVDSTSLIFARVNAENYSSFHDLVFVGTQNNASVTTVVSIAGQGCVGVGLIVSNSTNISAGQTSRGFGTGAVAGDIQGYINCIGCGTDGAIFYSSSDEATFYYNCVAYGGAGKGFEEAGAGTHIATNCIAQGNGSTDFGGSFTKTTCVEDESAVFKDAAGEDFHLAANDTSCRGAGTSLAADGVFAFNDDIDGNTISGNWCIGADFFLSVAITASLDALIKRSGIAATPGIDAIILRAGATVAAGMDAVLQSGGAPSTIIAGLDALVKALRSQAAGMDGVLKKTGITSTADLDARIQRSGVEAAAGVDGVLKKTDVAVTLDLDARIKKSDISQAVDLDGVVKQNNVESAADLDGAIQQNGVSEAVDLDAMLKQNRSQSVEVDGVIKQVDAASTAGLDAVIKKTGLSQAADLDAGIKKTGISQTADLDALIQQADIPSLVDMDAIIHHSGISVTAGMDALIKQPQVVTVVMDALAKALGRSQTAGMDGKIQQTGITNSALLDALIQQPTTLAAVIDAIVRAENIETAAAMDAIIQNVAGAPVSAVLDAILRNSATYNVLVDSIVKRVTEPPAGSGGQRKAKITIDHTKIPSALSVFHFKVSKEYFPDECLALGGAWGALQGGSDLRFSYDPDYNQPIAADVVRFEITDTPAEALAAVWLRLENVSATTDTDIWVWYHDPSAVMPAYDSTYGRYAVWSPDYEMVYNFAEQGDATVGDIKNSTSDSKHANSGNGYAEFVPTRVNGNNGNWGQYFDISGRVDMIVVPGGNFSELAFRTYSCLFKPLLMNNPAWLFKHSPNVFGNTEDFFYYQSSNKIAYQALVDFEYPGTYDYTSMSSYVSGYTSYHTHALKYDGTRISINANGVEAVGKNSIGSKTMAEPASNFVIGNADINPVGFNYCGYMDYFRIAKTALSNAYLAAWYANELDAVNFASVGAAVDASYGWPHFLMDAILQASGLTTVSLDALLRQGQFMATRVDAILQAYMAQNAQMDAVVQENGIAVQAGIDSLIKRLSGEYDYGAFSGDETRKAWVTASSEYDVNHPTDMIFDGAINNYYEWASTAANGPNVDGSCWISINVQTPMRFNKIRIQGRNSGLSFCPKDFKVYGSSTSDFNVKTELYSGQCAELGQGQWSEWFTLTAPNSYQYYRIEFHSGWSGNAPTTQVALSEIEFYRSEVYGVAEAGMDAKIVATVSVGAEFDALLKKTYVQHGLIDAMIQASDITRQTVMDALILTSGIGEAVMDALIQKPQVLMAALGAVIRSENMTVQAVVDACIRNSAQTSTEIDSLILLMAGNAVYIDACIGDGGTLVTMMDALVWREGDEPGIKNVVYAPARRRTVSAEDRVRTIAAAGRIRTVTAPARRRTVGG